MSTINTQVYLRDLQEKDIEKYLYWNHPSREFHDWNGPYFIRETIEELKTRVNSLLKAIRENKSPVLESKKAIIDEITEELVGEVNWYWKSKETNWMEVGLVIFNEDYWGKGIGTKALSLWITEQFVNHPEIVRLGLTTWSGNIGMIKVAEKLGMQKEAVYRKARIVNGKYYDSVSFGVLRDEWVRSCTQRVQP